MELVSLIEEAKQVYATAGLDCGHGLLPPADEEAIDRLGAELQLPIPPSLRLLWRTHCGQSYFGAGVDGLFGHHRLLTPDESLESYRLVEDGEEPGPQPRGTLPRLLNRPVPELIPFGSWDAYVLCVHAADGEVWEYLPSPGLLRHRVSIEAFLGEVIAEVRAGREADITWA